MVVRCPSCFWTSFTPAPEATMSDAAVCRRSWTRSFGGRSPALIAVGVKLSTADLALPVQHSRSQFDCPTRTSNSLNRLLLLE